MTTDSDSIRQGTAVVDTWSGEDGVGSARVDDTGHLVWIHFSMIEDPTDAYRELLEGERIELTYEPAGQDGFDWRALRVSRPLLR